MNKFNAKLKPAIKIKSIHFLNPYSWQMTSFLIILLGRRHLDRQLSIPLSKKPYFSALLHLLNILKQMYIISTAAKQFWEHIPASTFQIVLLITWWLLESNKLTYVPEDPFQLHLFLCLVFQVLEDLSLT